MKITWDNSTVLDEFIPVTTAGGLGRLAATEPFFPKGSVKKKHPKITDLVIKPSCEANNSLKWQ